MDYRSPYTYVLNREGGTKTILLTGLALFSTSVIPIVGAIVVMGYAAEVTEDIERDPDLKDHDEFDFQHFGRYLGRGVWPFLMSFLLQLVVAMALVVGLLAGVLVGLAADFNPALSGMVAYFVVVLPVSFLGGVVSMPLLLHTQLTGRFRFGEAVAFTARFLGKLWGQSLITLLVHMLISTVIVTVGLLFCCVGVYPAIVLAMFASDHYAVQLYRLYLAEGGTPIVTAGELNEYDEHE